MTFLIDGQQLSFDSEKALVQYLFDTARVRSRSLNDYMLDFAARAAIDNDHDIRAHDFALFVADATAAGYMKRID
jgi:hypothetical protein